jgi:thiamine pyrophosphokinase
MRIVVVASGVLAPGDETWLDGADLVFAADGGANALDRLGRRPDRLVGDLDSADHALVARLEAAGTRIDRHPVDKEASDTELALRAALTEGAAHIDLLGATGGNRLDHELANLLLLADPAYSGVELRAVIGATTIRAVRGGQAMALRGTPGDLVTLLPIGGDVDGVTTAGLRWQLDGAALPMGGSRGLSNVIVESGASVRLTDGVLLVVETASVGEHP